MDNIFKIESYSDFEQVAEEILNNLYHTRNPVTLIEESVVNEAKNHLRSIIFNCNFDISKVKEVLHEKNLDQDKTKCLTSLIDNKKNTLLLAGLNFYNSSHGETVSDSDWCLKLVFGTSESKTLRYSLLQLNLDTVNSKGEQKKHCLDLNKEIVLKFIDTLETACKN